MKKLSNIACFLEGITEIDIFQQTLTDPTGGKTDEQLLKEDWFVIGQDIKKAISQIKKNNHYYGYYKKTAKA